MFSCSRKHEERDETIFDEQFYSALNFLIETRIKDVSVVKSTTSPVYRKEDILKRIAHDSSSVSQSISNSYGNYIFDFLVDREVLDTREASFMYDSIDSTLIINIDSTKINLPVISTKKLDEFLHPKNSEVGILDIYKKYDTIRNTYGRGYIAQVLTPVFNSDYSVAIISIDYVWGPMVAHGRCFVLKKEKNRWVIDQDFQRWET